MEEAGPAAAKPTVKNAARPVAVAASPVKPLCIKSFTLCDFRAFAGPEPVTFKLDGKNLLIYGENGAGKSSVFHALDEFFSVTQRGPQARKDRLLALKNIFSGQPEKDIKISVEFDDGAPAAEWTTSKHPVDIALNADTRVTNAAYRKAFLDYRSLLDTNYLHGDGPLNLFEVSVNVLLRDFNALHDRKPKPIFDLWSELIGIIDPSLRKERRLKPSQTAQIFSLIDSLNAGLRSAITQILPKIGPLLVDLGWGEVEVASLSFAGLTYKANSKIPALQRLENKRIELELKFRNEIIARPQNFLNEARLSALALAIYFAGRQVCASTLQSNTPRLMVLDDLLIGLDQSNRLPVLDVLAAHFKDWQIILLTHDRTWFEMARAYQRRYKADKFWRYAKIHSNDDPTAAPVVSLASSSAAADVLVDGRSFLKQGHINAAGNYARIAVELALREFCETKKIPVAYQRSPDKTPASDLLVAAKNFSVTVGHGVYEQPLAAIEMYTSILFNKLSHGGVPAITSHEVQGALNAVDGLLFALKVVPTNAKADKH